MTKKSWAVSILLLGAVLGSAILLKPPNVPKGGATYPLVGMYSSLRTADTNFVKNGVPDSLNCYLQSMYDFTIIDGFRDGPNRAALELIEAMSPSAKLFDYFDAGQPFQCGKGWYGQTPPDPGCSKTTFMWSRWIAIGQDSGLVFSKLTGKPFTPYGVFITDFARRGLARALADTILAWRHKPSARIFLDETVEHIDWLQSLGDSIDYKRDGYATFSQWDSAFAAGFNELYTRLRLGVGREMLFGNGGPTGPYKLVNGWMGENFPHMNPVGWESWHALLNRADSAYVTPSVSFICVERAGMKFTNPECQRLVRYVLGSASLHNSVVGVLAGSPFDNKRGWMPDQWADEFAVDSLGRSVRDPKFKGWLGRAKGPAQVVAWMKVYTDTGAVMVPAAYRRDFDNGIVLVNPSYLQQTLMLEDGFVRILGVADPITNSGVRAAAVSIRPNDALFLRRM